MRWYSNEASYDVVEVSGLALCETVITVVIVITLVILSDRMWVIGLWSCVGWLYLLRNPASTKRSCVWFWWVHQKYNSVAALSKEAETPEWASEHTSPQFPIPHSIGVRWYDWILVLISATIIKITATAVELFRHPLLTLRSIPDNWIRTIVCLDSLTPLDLVPGYRAYLRESKADLQKDQFVSNFIFFSVRQIRVELLSVDFLVRALMIGLLPLVFWNHNNASDFESVFQFMFEGMAIVLAGYAIATSPFRLAVYIPAIAYRLILKATAIAYCPLLSGIYRASSVVSVQNQYEYQRNGKWPAFRVKVAYVIVLLFLGKIIARSLEVQLSQLWISATVLGEYFAIQFETYRIPVWQWATMLNALITIGFFYVADELLWRIRHGKYVNESMMKGGIQFVAIASGILSSYSIRCKCVDHHSQNSLNCDSGAWASVAVTVYALPTHCRFWAWNRRNHFSLDCTL